MPRHFLFVFSAFLACTIQVLAQPPRPMKPGTLGPNPKSSPGAQTAEDILPPPPPIPDPPADSPRPAAPTPAIGPSPLDLKSPAVQDDPFQQVPRDRTGTKGKLKQASDEFSKKRYPEALVLFVEADRNREEFTPAQRDEWAYCRLHLVASHLNRSSDTVADFSKLKAEVDDAMRSGSSRLQPFGKQLLDEIRRRIPSSTTAASGDWQSIETASFRVLYQTRRELAVDVSQLVESAKTAMYERWLGASSGNWSPRCDIYLYSTGSDYAKSTGKPAEQPGHSTVEIRGGRVTNRRIDIRTDSQAILDDVLPSEVTQVMLAEIFAEEPLPRWAVIGMAGLSESPEGVARYQRTIPTLYKEGKLFAVGPFMEQMGFAKPESMTVFYAQSVSLVSFLVQQRGPKAFTAFLREAPRRGYAKTLASHYSFKDAADLQNRWLRHAVGGQ